MCQFCPKCGRLAEYDPYYERMFCTSCDWSKRETPKDKSHDNDDKIDRKYLEEKQAEEVAC